MTGLLIFAVCTLGIAWLVYCEVRAGLSASPESWVVVAWAVIYASRPVTSWFSGAGEGSGLPESYDEGNPTEAFIYLSLMVIGLMVLVRRRVRLSAVMSQNAWLAAFYVFWLMSVLWSEYPLITVKRLAKDLGTVIMVLVVLTDRSPREAIRAVFARFAYVCVPLSLAFIRYVPHLGRAYVGYDRSELMYVGVATHKNTLGTLSLIAALFLLWDLLQRREPSRGVAMRMVVAGRLSVLAMSWYLLLIADSATSLICAALGSALLLVLARLGARRCVGRLEAVGAGAVLAFWMLDSFFGLWEVFVRSLGRDVTLTTRTDIWPILLGYQDNFFFGVGFNTFWAGERLLLLHDSVGSIIQAHNGFLETYLNGGMLGVGLLAIVLMSAYRRIRAGWVRGARESSLRLVLLVLALVHNLSEASFNKQSALWLVTLLAIMEYRRPLGGEDGAIPPAQRGSRLAGRVSA